MSMTPEQFCYWLNGFGELSPDVPTPEQWQSIKDHLATVFNKATPAAPGELGRISRSPAPPYSPQDPWRQGKAMPSPLLPGMPVVTC